MSLTSLAAEVNLSRSHLWLITLSIALLFYTAD